MNRYYDPAFKTMAVELAYAKGSIKLAADELGIEGSILSKWRLKMRGGPPILSSQSPLSEEQKQIRQLQWELKESNLERDILKKAVSIFSKVEGKPTHS
jgi:transposase